MNERRWIDKHKKMCSCTNWSLPTNIPNFSAVRPTVPKIRKRGAHVRTCRCTPPLSSVKRIANWSLTTHQISAQSVQPFPRYGTQGNIYTCARAHVRTCRCTPPMTCGICIATWALTTHQIWWQSAQPFLSYSLAGHFDTLHAARGTRQAHPPNESNLVAINFKE